MNRIILIGNGFDLAHKMKTCYRDFLQDLWQKTIGEIHLSAGKEEYENDDIIIRNIPKDWQPNISFQELKALLKDPEIDFEFKNSFLQRITERDYIQNWVDIENEYYGLLLECIENQNNLAFSTNIKSLNKDFLRLKELLTQYLEFQENEFNNRLSNSGGLKPLFKNQIKNKIFTHFNLLDLEENTRIRIIQAEFNKFLNLKEKSALIGSSNINDKMSLALLQDMGKSSLFSTFQRLVLSTRAPEYIDLEPNSILFLNFNYTLTEFLYQNPDLYNMPQKIPLVESIHIHGSLRPNDKNPIIFGFGDELDENYKKIENLNDNHFLENIKSIKYLETDNYKKLLQFINSDKYQVFIMGHSCGISDRTLLNTVFEHENCASIKPYYHKKPDGTDNYSDIIKNISRNFNSKALMRDRVVNKTYCEPLVE